MRMDSNDEGDEYGNGMLLMIMMVTNMNGMLLVVIMMVINMKMGCY